MEKLGKSLTKGEKSILRAFARTRAKKHQNAKSNSSEKLKTEGLVFFVSLFSCDLQDLTFQYVNHEAFGTNFLHRVDFKVHTD